MNHLGVDMRVLAEGDIASRAGDVALVAGVDCLLQDIRHRLSSPRGSLPLHPDWGCDVLSMLQEEDTPLQRVVLAQAIRAALTDEPRVRTAAVAVVGWGEDEVIVDVSIEPAGEVAPMLLTLGFGVLSGEVTLEVLSA